MSEQQGGSAGLPQPEGSQDAESRPATAPDWSQPAPPPPPPPPPWVPPADPAAPPPGWAAPPPPPPPGWVPPTVQQPPGWAAPPPAAPVSYEPVRSPLGDGPAWSGGAPLGGVVTPVGAMTVRPAADPVVRRRRIGGVVAVLGGGAVIAGTFADWVRADLRGVGIVIGTGWDNVRGNVGDGPVIALLGLAVVAIGAAMAVGLAPRVLRYVGVAAALGALGASIYEIVDITTAPASLDASLRVGPWVMVAGAIVGFVGLLVAPAGVRTPAAPHQQMAPSPSPPLVPPSGPPLLQ